MTQTPERTIDKDFDQTALHIHGGRLVACPTCIANRPVQPFTGPMQDVIGDDRPATSAETPSPDPHIGKIGGKNLSPALLGQRIINLTREKEEAEAERDALKRRVEGFERLVGIFANHIDQMQQAIDRHNAPVELKPAA